MPITKATASSVAPAAKGDLVVGSATNDAAVLGVGANGTTLVADSSTATGLKWQAASAAAFVGCKLYKTSDQSISNATHTAITYQAEYFDTDSFHDTSTNTSRITIPAGKGGKYLIVCKAFSMEGNTTGVRNASIRLNNTTDIVSNAISIPGVASNAQQYFSAIWELTAGDYIEHRVYQNSTATLQFYGSGSDGQYSTEFSVQYLGA